MSQSSTPPQRLSIRRKVLLGFGLVLAMLALVAFISFRSMRAFLATADRVAQTHEVIEMASRTQRQLMEMESARRGFLLTGDERLLAKFRSTQTLILTSVDMMRLITAQRSARSSGIEQLRPLLERRFAAQEGELQAFRTQGSLPGPTRSRLTENESALQDVRQQLLSFEAEQRETLQQSSTLTRLIGRATIVGILTGTAFTFAVLIVACQMILRDIAARRRAEEALASEHNLLSSIIDTMPDHVFVKDAKGRFILDNAAHRRYLGHEDDSDGVEGRTVFDYFNAPTASRYQEDDLAVLETGQPIFNREEAVTLPGRPESWLETTKVPLRDVDGTIVGLVGISSDISTRKADEEKLKHFAAQLERSNTELQNFASVASHDLQEPLRKIQAFGDRLKAKCGDQLGENGRDYLDRMQNAAQRMQTLIQDLLKLSRVTSRALPFQSCDLSHVVQGVITDLEVIIEQQRAVVKVQGLPTIDADALQMRQLFQNLISNGLKFHPPEQAPVVEISGRIVDASEELIPGAPLGSKVCEITVRDNGIGFDPSFAEQIFVVFQRLHTRLEFEGTGIGLAVCRKITDRHGGKIVAKSSEGQGATFIVTLPVKQLSQEAHDQDRDANHHLDGGR